MSVIKRRLARLPAIKDILEIRSHLSNLSEQLTVLDSRHQDLLRCEQEQLKRSVLAGPRYADPRHLNRCEGQVFSQNGEDGILSEIFRRIGVADRRFVEIGVEDGLESNTAYRLALGWSGTWIDADAGKLERARETFRTAIVANRLQIVDAFVTSENVAALLERAGVPTEFDLLSLDIDRNTFHVWKGLSAFRPRVAVVEYNASIPPGDEWVAEYDPRKQWNGTVYFGAALKSLEFLGAAQGYSLVACDLSGVNAFFVRRDLTADHFVPPFSAEYVYHPPRYWMGVRAGHPRGFSG